MATNDTAPPRSTRVRLTDQALVAVTAARQAAEGHGDQATVADLLVGLAAESEGHAGALLRAQPSAASLLVERASAGAHDLPLLDTVVRRAAARALPRPAPTGALLAALLELGGRGVTELLSTCGFDPPQLYRATTEDTMLSGETFGLGSDPDLSSDAAAAVARVRATAGGAVELVVAIAATPDGDTLLHLDEYELTALGSSLRDESPDDEGWDRGLQVVLDTVRTWREPPLGVSDLLRAAVTAGGEGPRRLVEEAARHEPPETS